jgi:hypothetical protein
MQSSHPLTLEFSRECPSLLRRSVHYRAVRFTLPLQFYSSCSLVDGFPSGRKGSAADRLNKQGFGGPVLRRGDWGQVPRSGSYVNCVPRRQKSGRKAGHPAAQLRKLGSAQGHSSQLRNRLAVQARSYSTGNAAEIGGGREGRMDFSQQWHSPERGRCGSPQENLDQFAA